MGKRSALELGLALSLMASGCSTTERDFAEATGGGDGGETAAGPSGGGKPASGGRAGEPSDSLPEAGISSGGAPSGDDSCDAEHFDDGARCQPLTPCADTEYEVTAPSATSDRVCSPLAVCGAGTWVSSQPTAKSDRACSACASSTFSNTINATACAPWASCKMGESESVAPSATTDRVCSTCGAGKYESSGTCKALTVCSTTQYESTPATSTSDRKCSAVQSCQPGSEQTAAPTATTDRQCAACASGAFSTQVNATSCKAWSVCGSNQKQTAAGTATTDVVCVDKPACNTAPDRTCTVDCPCASGEGVCTASNQCVSGATCVPGSGKKVGRAGDTCLANHCNNDTKDSTETSVDCGGECGCRATFEVVPLKGIPANLYWGEFKTLSRDGKRLAGFVDGDRTSFPATVAADGTVTQLQSFGKTSTITASSADGSVLVGGVACTDPPGCTDQTWSIAKWAWSSPSATPTLSHNNGDVKAVSSSGTVVTGDFADTDGRHGFILNGNTWLTIPDLESVTGITPDGKYVAGAMPNSAQAVLWEAQTQKITKIGSATWDDATINAVNGTTPVVVGFGYMTPETYVGFRWKSGTLTELGVLAGASTMPAAVSLDGATVIGRTGGDYPQAFIWTESGKLRLLVDELIARGYEPPVDLTLTYAEFISDDGKTIIGEELVDPPAFWRVVLQ